ncbi:MAG: histidine phosphatase family protein [Thermoleophilia bacterium]|nr:histidine phosphatase family protein [Thermoleophilia bacterium]
MAPTHVLLTRHGRSTYNDRGILNGDPSVPVGLTAEGKAQCLALAVHLAGQPIDLAVHTPFPRTAESLELMLAGRVVPTAVMEEFGDVRLGEFEGRPVGEFRAWRRAHGLDARPAGGGESRMDVLRRYAGGYERLLSVDAGVVLAVVHDVTIRMMVNATAGDDPIDGSVKTIPNAELYRFTPDELRRGLERMQARAAQPADAR